MQIICWSDVEAGLALILFTVGRSGPFSASLPFPPPSGSNPDCYPRSARAALICVLVSSLLCLFSAGFLPRQSGNENVDALLCKGGSPSPSCGAQDEAQWQAGCPDTAGSFSLLPTAERPKSISEFAAKAVSYCFTRA